MSDSNSMSESDSDDFSENEEIENSNEIDTNPRKKNKKYYDLPTKEEQMYLRETESLMKSNLLNLQIQEMLEEVCIENENRKSLNKWLDTFVDLLKNCKPKKSTITYEWIQTKGIKGLNVVNENTSINFMSPQQVDMIGSFQNHSSTKPFLNVDLLVTMNSQCFSERFDYNIIL